MAKAQDGKVEGTFLLRDKHGRVKFDDWFNIPDSMSNVFTDDDWEYVHKKRLETQEEN